MKILTSVYRFLLARKLLAQAGLFVLNIGCSISCFVAGDWKKAVYWIASALCIAMVSI